MRCLSQFTCALERRLAAATENPAICAQYRAFLCRISPRLLVNHRYQTKLGRVPDLKNPVTFDEKLLWLMLYWRHPLKTLCGDKYTLRSYVEQHGWGHLLPKLLGVYGHSREIDFEILPGRFVLKCTHGNKFNIICQDKARLDRRDACRQLDRWLATDISKIAGEIHYAAMKPRIICEEFLDDRSGGQPVDYKLYCFGGKVHCTLVCTRRGELKKPRSDFYDLEWKTRLPYDNSNMPPEREIPKPAGYGEMMAAAEALSKPFPFVRMDFYSIQGRAVLGEMTFTPCACMDLDYTDLAQQQLGDLITLPPRFPSALAGEAKSRLGQALRHPAVRTRYRAFLGWLSPVLLAKHFYRSKFGVNPDLRAPQTFNEKLLWLMLYWRHPLKTECGDKYTMRAYVEQQGWAQGIPRRVLVESVRAAADRVRSELLRSETPEVVEPASDPAKTAVSRPVPPSMPSLPPLPRRMSSPP